jgi:cell division protein FtsQ
MTETLPAPLDVRLMNATASGLFAAVAVLGLAAIFWWGLRHPLFSIAAIHVQGDLTHNNAVTLRVNVASRLTGNFFTLDLVSARRAFEAVPWVRKAVIRREFPNLLTVQLQEHQPVAYWGLEGESFMLNSFGEVFEANQGDVEADDLPRLTGPQDQSAQLLEMYRLLLPLFEPIDLTPVKLELTDRGSWRVHLDTGAVMELGRGTPAEIAGQTQRFVRTVTQATSKYNRTPEAIESADFRHGSGYALRLRGVTTVLAEVPKPRK